MSHAVRRRVTTGSDAPRVAHPPRHSPLVTLVALLIGACAPSAPGSDASLGDASVDASRRDAAPSDAGTWAGWPACDPAATSQRLTFVHVNDLHAHYTPDDDGISAFARVRHYYERTRLDSPYTIFTDGGDDHEKGSVAELLSEGLSTIDAVRALELDVRVIGNHDFAWSLDELLEFTSDPHAAVLTANHHYHGAEPSRWHAEEYRVIQVGCVRVGFSGLTSGPWDERDRPISEPFYPELDATYDYVAEARRVLDAHADEADIWVFVDHIGQGEDEALAAAVPEIDVVLSGHSHTYTPSPVSSGSAVVVQSGSFAQFVVRLDVDVDLATHAVTVHDYSSALVAIEPPSEAVNAAIAASVSRYAPDARREIGQVSRSLDDAAVADVTARAAVRRYGANAALIDTDTVWQTWRAGPVTPQDLADTFRVERERSGTPGFSSLYRVHVTGAQLRTLAALEGARWRFEGPSVIDDATTYLLVIQKRAAFHPDEQLGPTFAFAEAPEPLDETWAAVDAYARMRTAACVYLDDDATMPDCGR